MFVAGSVGPAVSAPAVRRIPASAREQTLRWRAAFDGDGRLRALDVQARSDHGVASPGHGWGMGLVGALTIGTGYALDECRVQWDVVATNKAPWGGTKPSSPSTSSTASPR